MSQMPAPHPNKDFKCGQCRWFYVGFENRTCIHSRGVQQLTQACIEFEPYKPGAFDRVARDKYIVGIEGQVRTLAADYVKQILAELKTYRISTTTKITINDFGDEADLLELINKFERNQAYSERLVELREELIEKHSSLNRMMKDAQAYLLTNYREHIGSLKNEGERGAFYHNALPKLFDAIDEVDGLVKRIDRLLQGLKDTHFSLCQIQDGVKRIWEFRIQAMTTSQRINRTKG